MRRAFLQRLSILSAAGLVLTACNAPALPTRAAAATVPPAEQTAAAAGFPATWTPDPAQLPPSPTSAGLPSQTPRLTATPFPTFTPRPPPSATLQASPTAMPTPTVGTPTQPAPIPAPNSPNYLPNPSFENGWYNQDGVPELQVAQQWRLEWEEGPNPLDPDPWNALVRPESRVLHADLLPPAEHSLFIWDGVYTVKIFKQNGAISFRLLTELFLEPGTYVFEVNAFPDLVDHYLPSGEKVWAPDPLSGELRFLTGAEQGPWIFPTFGQKNTFQHAFEITTAQVVQVGVAFRGRWAIANNGWFLDDWSLRQISQPGGG